MYPPNEQVQGVKSWPATEASNLTCNLLDETRRNVQRGAANPLLSEGSWGCRLPTTLPDDAREIPERQQFPAMEPTDLKISYFQTVFRPRRIANRSGADNRTNTRFS